MATELKPGKSWSAPEALLRCSVTFVLVASAVILAKFLGYYWHSSPDVSLLLCAIMCSAWFGGIWQAFLAITLASLAFNYYFLPPIHSFAVHLKEMPRLIFFVLAAIFVGFIAGAQRRTAESLRRARDDLAAKVRELQRTNDSLHLENAERQQAEKALRRSETYLAEAQRLSHTGSFGWRVASGEIQWSEETFRIFQYDPKSKPSVELILQRVHPDAGWIIRG